MVVARPLSSPVYGIVRPVYLFFVLCFLLSPSRSFAENRYLDALLAASHEKNLSQNRTWQVLLHYQQKHGRWESLIDDPRFFLAPDGKTNPDGELDSTLTAFFSEEQQRREHPRCRFVARYAWLKEQLGIDESKLPHIECAEFKEAFSRINARSAVLVFPAAHINGPASMFGHTLVRVDSENRTGLLSQAVTYAANVTDTNGLLFVFKGLFGYYHGYFTVLPYYNKVAEYNDIEQRDIWEYRLSLTPEEVQRMMLHAWEVRDIYSDYYFFDENCAYDLLLMLDTARPSLHLTDRFRQDSFGFWVIPVDTIRTVRDAGIVTDETYRPSLATRIRAIASDMSKDDQNTAINVSRGKTSAAEVLNAGKTREAKIRVLDLSAELLQYEYARKEIPKEEYLKRFLPALNARSGLGPQDENAYPITPPAPPEQGHLPSKAGIAAGYRTDSWFTEVSWRAAYHDLLDPDPGFTEGAQINFMDIRARYFFKEDSLKLWQARLIDIVSLAPRSQFISPISWKVNTGLDRELLADGEDHLVYRLNPGGGFAWQSAAAGIAYAMAEADLNLSGALKQNYALGFGLSAGLLKQVTAAWKIHVSASALFYELGDEHQRFKAELAQSYAVSRRANLTLSLSREKSFDLYRTDAVFAWNVYLH